MKNTGIIRRIDCLGRIVLPKDMRNANGLTEGTPLEIIPGDNGDIILRKHNSSGSLIEIAGMLTNYIYSQNISPETAEILNNRLLEIVDALPLGGKR